MTGVKRYRKKPVEVEAVQWTGENVAEIGALTEPSVPKLDPVTRTLYFGGDQFAKAGDFIVRDFDGALRGVTPRAFEATYEEVPADER